MRTEKKIIIILVALVVLTLMGFILYYHYGDDKVDKDHFGTKVYSEMKVKPTQGDEEIAMKIIKSSNKAFSCYGSEKEANKKFGALSVYCHLSSDYSNFDREKHKLKFITAKTNGANGYIWVKYYSIAYDKNGEIINGSGTKSEMITARWKISNISGTWVVTCTDEAP